MGTLGSAIALTMLQAAALEPATAANLPALPNAVDVVRKSTSTTSWVAYDVREAYPALQTIGLLVEAMSKAGWKLAEVGGFKASWPAPADFTPPQRPRPDWPTHVWRGRWLGRGGQEAEFRLTYSCPMESAGMHSVWVRISGAVYGAKEAALRDAARRRILEECRAGQTVSPECEQ